MVWCGVVWYEVVYIFVERPYDLLHFLRKESSKCETLSYSVENSKLGPSASSSNSELGVVRV